MAEREIQDGAVKGKLTYMRPEQAQGEEVDARSDVFALGIVLFELCTQSSLFQFDSPMKTFSAVVGPAPIPRARDRNPDLDVELDAIIAKALERDLGLRYQSGAELHQELETWLRREEAVGPAAIAGFMASLFAERMAQRHLLVEKARLGLDVSSGVREISQRIETGPHPRPSTSPDAFPDSSPQTSTHPVMPVAPIPSAPLATSPTQASAPPGISARPRAVSSPSLGSVTRAPTGSHAEPRRRQTGATRSWVPWLVVAGVVGVGGAVAWSHRQREPAPSIGVVPLTPPAASGVLTIRSVPPLGAVVVDGRDRGLAPVTIAELELGEHTIEVHLEGRIDNRHVVSLERPGRLWISSSLFLRPRHPFPQRVPSPWRQSRRVRRTPLG